jgi:hypothetical protein
MARNPRPSTRVRSSSPTGAKRRGTRQVPSTPRNVEFAADELAEAAKFARSVGGIEKAEALLEQLKAAKESSPMHREGL